MYTAQTPTVLLLNVDATSHQPVQDNSTPPTLEKYQEHHGIDSTVSLIGFHAENTFGT